jgi:hypothetical protein
MSVATVAMSWQYNIVGYLPCTLSLDGFDRVHMRPRGFGQNLPRMAATNWPSCIIAGLLWKARGLAGKPILRSCSDQGHIINYLRESSEGVLCSERVRI